MKAEPQSNNVIWIQSTKFGLVLFALVVFLGEPFFNITLGAVIIYSLFNWQIALPLLFYSGILKHSRLIESLPIDFTLICFFLFILFFVKQLIFRPRINVNTLILTLLVGLLMAIVSVSIFTTDAPFDYVKSSGMLILLLYLPLVIMIINVAASINMKRWLRLFMTITMILGWIWVGMGFHNELFDIPIENKEVKGEILWFMTAFGESYVAFSIFSGLIFLIIFQNLFQLQKEKLLSIVGLLILSYSLLSSPARGITLGLVFCMTIFFWNTIFRNLRRFGGVIFSLLVVVGLLFGYLKFYASTGSQNVFSRLLNYDFQGDSFQHRIRFIRKAFEHWIRSPFFGTGVDSVAFYNGDKGSYAHNLFIEVILEYGLIGSIPFIFFFMLCFFSAYKLWELVKRQEDYVLLWIVNVFIVLSIYGIFSASLGQMRQVWIIFSLVIAIAMHQKLVVAKSVKIVDKPF